MSGAEVLAGEIATNYYRCGLMPELASGIFASYMKNVIKQ